MSKFNDLTGMKFGRLTVIKRGEDRVSPSGRHRVTWDCMCDCGNTLSVHTDNLTRGKSNSCGCIRKEMMSKRQRTHGDTDTKLYGIWSAIKARCYNENTIAYKDYGGRGIKMCEEWRNDYTAFKDWACENGYKNGLSIDRENNILGYCPENCRWVDASVQANNRRSNRVYTIGSETHNLTEWANKMGINPKTVFTRVYSGMDIETALGIKSQNTLNYC